MKTIISILIVLIGATGFLFSRKSDDHRSCACTGALCSCTVTCKDVGELPSCQCAALTCSCTCGPIGIAGNDPQLPTMDATQELNSTKAEGYFRKVGTVESSSIADGIKSLREAIKQGNSNKYQTNAGLVESAYSRLPEAQKTAWENWSEQNLKK